mgnify:CR=1 FL=1
MSQTAQKILNRFWEFLMLFIAITLGFFVENYREGLSKAFKGVSVGLLVQGQTKYPKP